MKKYGEMWTFSFSFTENCYSISYQKGELWQLHQFGKIILSP